MKLWMKYGSGNQPLWIQNTRKIMNKIWKIVGMVVKNLIKLLEIVSLLRSIWRSPRTFWLSQNNVTSIKFLINRSVLKTNQRETTVLICQAKSKKRWKHPKVADSTTQTSKDLNTSKASSILWTTTEIEIEGMKIREIDLGILRAN